MAQDRDGGKHLGRHLFFLDSAATTEEKKKIMNVWTITKCVKSHMNHSIEAYPATRRWKYTLYGSKDVIREP